MTVGKKWQKKVCGLVGQNDVCFCDLCTDSRPPPDIILASAIRFSVFRNLKLLISDSVKTPAHTASALKTFLGLCCRISATFDPAIQGFLLRELQKTQLRNLHCNFYFVFLNFTQ
jgi:hypothetical protein